MRSTGWRRYCRRSSTGSVVSVEQAADGVNRLARSANVDIGPLAEGLRKAGNSAATAFASAEGAFDTVSSAVDQRLPAVQGVDNCSALILQGSRITAELGGLSGETPGGIDQGQAVTTGIGVHSAETSDVVWMAVAVVGRE